MISKQLLVSIILLVCTSSMHFAYAHDDCHDLNAATYKNTYEQDTNGEYLSAAKRRFSINPSSPGVVIDHQTKTMWYRCIFPGVYKNGACDKAGSPTINIVTGFGYITDRSWYNAFQSARAANVFVYGGYTDWRLPNLNELAFIVDRGCAAKATTDDQYNAFPEKFFLKTDNDTTENTTDDHYFTNSENEVLGNAQQIWSATPKIFDEGTALYTSYTLNFTSGTEDLQAERKVSAEQKNVFVILMRSCTQEDEC